MAVQFVNSHRSSRTHCNAALKLLLEQIWQTIFIFDVSSFSRPVHKKTELKWRTLNKKGRDLTHFRIVPSSKHLMIINMNDQFTKQLQLGTLSYSHIWLTAAKTTQVLTTKPQKAWNTNHSQKLSFRWLKETLCEATVVLKVKMAAWPRQQKIHCTGAPCAAPTAKSESRTAIPSGTCRKQTLIPPISIKWSLLAQNITQIKEVTQVKEQRQTL